MEGTVVRWRRAAGVPEAMVAGGVHSSLYWTAHYAVVTAFNSEWPNLSWHNIGRSTTNGDQQRTANGDRRRDWCVSVSRSCV
ncbi:nucleoid disruption protein [Sesbania bispinosa]|nr:nucleoid disruption protein [Sesbania bispinosa]